jgi:hypothetical protein
MSLKSEAMTELAVRLKSGPPRLSSFEEHGGFVHALARGRCWGRLSWNCKRCLDFGCDYAKVYKTFGAISVFQMGQGMEGLSIMAPEVEYITVSYTLLLSIFTIPAASMQKVRLGQRAIKSDLWANVPNRGDAKWLLN